MVMKKITAAVLGAVMAAGLASCGNKTYSNISVKDTGRVVWDNKAITVTFDKYDDSNPLCPNITLKAQNKTDIDLYLFTDGFYVNDFDYEVMMSQQIPPGETVDATFEVLEDAAETIGYTEVGKVSFWLMTNNPDKSNFDDVYLSSGEIVIDTGNPDWKSSQNAPQGELLYDDNGVKITALVNSRDCVSGSTIPMLIENSSGSDMNISMNAVRLDGMEAALTSDNSVTVKKGKNAVKVMSVFDGYNQLEGKQASKTEVLFTVVKQDGKENTTFETGYITVKGV